MNYSQLLLRALNGSAQKTLMPMPIRTFSQTYSHSTDPLPQRPTSTISSVQADNDVQSEDRNIPFRNIPTTDLTEEFDLANDNKSRAAKDEPQLSKIKRLPMNVQAIYLKPMKHTAKFGIPSCDLQLRSYSLRPLEFYSDFALRAAYYLELSAYGPVPLPQITERWTVPRSHFIFKKSQENFERVTKRRLIQIRDGDPEVVQIWLAFLRKHAFYGVGMKANIWEFSKIGVGKMMDAELPVAEESEALQHAWEHFAQDRPYMFKNNEMLEKLVEKPKFLRPYRDGASR